MIKDVGMSIEHQVDVLVLGAGIAGTRAALSARQAGAQVALAYLARGASPFIIGANVPLGHESKDDNASTYAQDMLEGGYHLGDTPLVNMLANQAVPAFKELEKEAIPFACNAHGYRQRHLSGNTFARSIYVPEGTGQAVLSGMDKTLDETDVLRLPAHEILGLLQSDGVVQGAVLVPRHQNNVVVVRAKATIIALGGVGRLYGDTTYPADVYGDGLMLALEAGARLTDMEFMQFEPVVTYWPEGARGMEMPTAMLGDGAYLLNSMGERFMFRYNPGQGERGIEKAKMALCIAEEVAQGRGLVGGTVRFDTTALSSETLESYVHHCRRLRKAGLDPARQGPLVRPAAHSIMGGIRVDEHGRTDVDGLYACGEATGGFHGASRIAGNGAGEAMTMGWVVGGTAAAHALSTSARHNCEANVRQLLADIPMRTTLPLNRQATQAIITDVRKVMDSCAGLFRDEVTLADGLASLASIAEKTPQLSSQTLTEVIEIRRVQGLLLLAQIVLSAGSHRTESRGSHQRCDFPDRDDAQWHCHLVWSLDSQTGSLSVERLAVT